MRRSIDDHPFDPSELPPGAEDAQPLSWAVAISDDYDDAEPRVVLTVEEVGRAGAGLVAHLDAGTGAAAARAPSTTRCSEIGEDAGPLSGSRGAADAIGSAGKIVGVRRADGRIVDTTSRVSEPEAHREHHPHRSSAA